MNKFFPLQIYTPEKTFFTGDVYSVTIEALNGRLSVLADHIPMVCALSAGMLKLRTSSGIKTAFHSEGFMDVEHDQVLIFSQACEWPEEIDAQRARAAAERAGSRMQNADEENINRNKVTLLRAMARLKVKESSAQELLDLRGRFSQHP